jgi:hypothetical protein
VSELDERRLLRVFMLKWGTEGMMPRFMIDGRKYDDSTAVRADIAEASEELSRRGIPAQFETRPIGPRDQGPLLPSWQEFRQRLELEDAAERPGE